MVAVTVSVEDPPELIVVGLAEIVTVGGPTFWTVTVAVAVTEPLLPVAVAVYVVVADGLTLSLPPPAGSV